VQKFENFKFKEIFEHIMQGKRLKISDHIIGNTPFVMAGYVNSGICDYISNSEARRFPTNSITIDIFGNCFYRSYEFAAGDDVGVFWSDKEINSKAMMYICAVIGKSLSSKFDFGNKLRASQTYDFEIPLPVIKNKEIDFYFMENYITSIEAKMQKLILYHSVLTLRERESRGDFNLIFSKDSSISNFIKEAIMQIAASLFGKLGVEWGEFRLVDLFKILLAKGDLQAKKLEVGDNILISSGNFNNGVVAYVQDCDDFSEKFGSNSLTIDMFGKCFYQPKPFYAVSHGRVNILEPKFKLNIYVGFFIAAILNKTLENRYSFNKMCSQTALKAENIQLPLNEFDKPNFSLMENFIKDIERNSAQKLIDYYKNLTYSKD
jgi:hypothetical protein